MDPPNNNQSPESKIDAVMPTSLYEWKERVLDGVLRKTFFVWVIALAVGIYEIFQSGQWPTRSAAMIATTLVYLLAGLAMGTITFRRQLSFGLRSGVILATVYVLGTVGLITRGIAVDGRLYFITFVTLTAIFFDLRRSLLALIVSALSIVTVRVLGSLELFPLLPDPPIDFWAWLIRLILFCLLSLAMVLAVAFLIRSLDRILAESHQERNLVSAILETAGALVVVFDPDGRIVRFNRSCEQITNYSFEEVHGRYVWDIFLTPGGIDLIKVVFSQIRGGNRPSAYESYWLTKENDRRLIAWTTTPLHDHLGNLKYIISTGIDITEHQIAEAEREQLLTAEHEQRVLAETLADITLALTSQTSQTAVLDEILRRVHRVVPFKTANIALLEEDSLRIVRWQGYEIFGGDDIVDNLVLPLSNFRLEMQAVNAHQSIVISDTRQEPQWITISGLEWIRSHLIVPIVIQERVLGLLRLDGNMPEEFSEEDALRLGPLSNAAAIALENARLHQETLRQAQRVQDILDTTYDGIVLLNADHKIELANPAAEEYLHALGNVHIGDRLVNFAGTPLNTLLQPPPDGGLAHELNISKIGRIFESAAHPLSGDAQTSGWVLILREVTEARKQQQYIQAQERLAMVGQLAAGIAHDFNNIMTVIILYSQMLLKIPEFEESGDQRMGIIFRQAKLAANLIAQILDFSRQSTMERLPVNLVYFLKELFKMLKRTLPENIELDLIYDDKEYGINADLTRMQQAVMNLAVNARDAMPDGGLLSISLEMMLIMPGEKSPLPGMEPGEWVVMTVSDTGIGISVEDFQHIFEPFFTTKDPGLGTGLGLAQVYGIIKQHEGFIDFESVEGEGTTFRIYLPSSPLADVIMPEKEEIEVSEGLGETILVVEDDDSMLEAICEILRTLNYKTLTAYHGEQALEVFRAHEGEIALVISDMVMPIMSGSTLYTHLQELDPNIKMVIVTGYPFDEQDRALLSRGIVAWVQKPFVMEQIAVAIRQALSL